MSDWQEVKTHDMIVNAAQMLLRKQFATSELQTTNRSILQVCVTVMMFLIRKQ